tara:strand:- start:31 stop:480 length:450 start_codon:yes stop_codon:yes gene_type:complete
MEAVILQVKRDQYPSLQVGDRALYINYANNESTGGFDVQQGTTQGGNNYNDIGSNTPNAGQIQVIGRINSIDHTTSLDDGTETTTIICTILESQTIPSLNDKSFIFFQKEASVNSNSVKGHFAKARFRNGSANRAELFAVGCEIHESSK